ncbi:hypothetical protein GJ496_002861 [Pomphorhynchus laevis]|nr:hypothetical protein GJ496_002861 [Pomphorhynchus laevis]
MHRQSHLNICPQANWDCLTKTQTINSCNHCRCIARLPHCKAIYHPNCPKQNGTHCCLPNPQQQIQSNRAIHTSCTYDTTESYPQNNCSKCVSKMYNSTHMPVQN